MPVQKGLATAEFKKYCRLHLDFVAASLYIYIQMYIYIRCPMPFFAGVFREMKGLPNHEPFLKQIGPFRGMGFKDGRAAGSVRSK